VGHHQPHLLEELGFYDLRLIYVQKRQIELEKNMAFSDFVFITTGSMARDCLKNR